VDHPPMWFLRHVWATGGVRQPKRVLLSVLEARAEKALEQRDREIVMRGLPAHYQGRPLALPPSRIVPADGTRITPSYGTLSNTEYAFWVTRLSSQGAKCRFCFRWEIGVDARRQHKLTALSPKYASLSCARRLQQAYKKLAHNKCIVCGEKTHKQSWGLYMCPGNCKAVWMLNPDKTYWELDKAIGIPLSERWAMRADNNRGCFP